MPPCPSLSPIPNSRAPVGIRCEDHVENRESGSRNGKKLEESEEVSEVPLSCLIAFTI